MTVSPCIPIIIIQPCLAVLLIKLNQFKIQKYISRQFALKVSLLLKIFLRIMFEQTDTVMWILLSLQTAASLFQPLTSQLGRLSTSSVPIIWLFHTASDAASESRGVPLWTTGKVLLWWFAAASTKPLTHYLLMKLRRARRATRRRAVITSVERKHLAPQYLLQAVLKSSNQSLWLL